MDIHGLAKDIWTSKVLRMTSFADDIFVSVGNSGEVVEVFV